MSPELKGLRILVVEDNFLVAEMTRELLEECGCEVVGPVARLGDALEVASSAELDGALLDINLAGEFCFPAAARLQERGVPFMFLTGYGEGSVVPSAFREAPRLRKPLDLDQVIAALARHFGSA
ncbi:MAG: response regulator [Pseudomonadota bacterium]